MGETDSENMLAAAETGYRFEEPETSAHNRRVLAAMAAGEPRHNHMTRDIKSPGKCPACDAYWAKREGD